MRLRTLVLLIAGLLCLSAARLLAQTTEVLPNAPHVAAVKPDEIIPEPPDVSGSPVSRGAALWQPTAAALAVTSAPPPRPKVLDKKFVGLGVLTFALTTIDVEFTQHCLHRGTCVELNPTLPHSRLGMYAVNTPVNLAVMYFSYRRRAAGKWGWWIAPVVDIGAHAVGVGSNVRFLGK